MNKLFVFVALLAAVFACSCAREPLPPQVPPPAVRPDPIATAIVAGQYWQAANAAREQQDTAAACVAKAIAGGKDPSDAEVVKLLTACKENHQKELEQERARTVSIKLLAECLQTKRDEGKTDALAREECAKQGKLLPGLRIKEDEEETSGGAHMAPPPPPPPFAPRGRMFIGRIGAAVPTGWNPSIGFRITRTPQEWSEEQHDHAPFCNMEVVVDGMPVWWTDGANRPSSVPVPPGTGLAVFGGLRASVLPAGDEGYIRFDRVMEPDGRIVPHYPSSSLHAVKARCWRYAVLPDTVAGAPRLGEYATLALELADGKARSGPGMDSLELPFRVFRPAPPLPTRPL
ncbi:hypothetical protein EPN90_02440 [Patescibacteria group bacterium]|nr:MAG: hypothetical protein EPN90_02440 [Patescibacteria group bacterium]